MILLITCDEKLSFKVTYDVETLIIESLEKVSGDKELPDAQDYAALALWLQQSKFKKIKYEYEGSKQ
jgi:hypothetical protein